MAEEKKISYSEFRTRNINELRENLKKKRRESYGDGNRKPPAFSMRMRYFRPTPDGIWIRLTPESMKKLGYTFYQVMTKNRAGKFRNTICNCHDGVKRLPCVSCFYAFKDENPKLLPSRRVAITTTVCEWYHKEKCESAKGNTYFKYHRCKGTDKFGKSACDMCDNDEMEKEFGRQLYWNLGAGHLEQLDNALKEIEERCQCGKGVIETYAYSCPECGNIERDRRKKAISPEEEAWLLNEDIVCGGCGKDIRATPLSKCMVQERRDTWVDGCDDPKPVSPWDCNLLVSTTGTGTSTAIHIDDFEVCEPSEDLSSSKLERMPFDDFLRVMSLEEQANNLERYNPFPEEDEKLLEPEVAASDEEDKHSSPRD